VLVGVSEAQLVEVEVEEEVGEREGEMLPLGDPDCVMPPVGVLMFTVEEVEGLEVGVKKKDSVEDGDTLLPLVLIVEVKVGETVGVPLGVVVSLATPEEVLQVEAEEETECVVPLPLLPLMSGEREGVKVEVTHEVLDPVVLTDTVAKDEAVRVPVTVEVLHGDDVKEEE